MAKNNRVGGIIEIKVDGVLYAAKGSFTYNMGANKREAVVGADVVHGYKEMPQAAKLEGALTDRSDMDVKTILNLKGVTATLSLANGKIIVFKDAWYSGDGNITTEEGEIELKMEAISAEEIR
jgi:hypothetical protein